MKAYTLSLSLLVISAIMGLGVMVASADHSWGGYHWAHAANPFTLKLGDNVSSSWDSYLQSSSAAWSADPASLYPGSSIAKVLNTSVVAGATKPKTCKAVSGTVQVCNSSYGKNGWLGLAQIWISGTHITKGTAKMNDTYFNTAKYNTPAWRNLVVCQEIAHTFGLDHQDEVFNNVNLGTCMDYTNAPAGGNYLGFNYGPSNERPNFHDFEELAIIYSHADSFNSFGNASVGARGRISDVAQSGDFESPAEWGKEVRRDARDTRSLYERDLGKGDKVVTFVIWAD